MTDAEALNQIATMLQDPDWGVGMLEDIAAIVDRAGYSVDTQYVNGEAVRTWDRH